MFIVKKRFFVSPYKLPLFNNLLLRDKKDRFTKPYVYLKVLVKHNLYEQLERYEAFFKFVRTAAQFRLLNFPANQI